MVESEFGYHSLPLDKADYVFVVIGLLLFAWVMATIFRPAVHPTRFIPVFHGGGVVMPNPQMAANYLFSSTHPSYVFIDLLACGFWWFTRWLWSQGWEERVYQGTILLALAALIPALRLFAWYGLRLRPKVDPTLQEEVTSAWRPVRILYLFLIGIALVSALVVIPMELRDRRERAEREAKLTVVEPDNWRGLKTFEELRDPEKQVATRVIRLRAVQESSEASSCGNKPGQSDFATVLVNLGRNDDVLIFSHGGWSELTKRAQGNEGKLLEAIGRLTPMPSQVPSWKKYCGLDELPRRPRWVLEEERP